METTTFLRRPFYIEATEITVDNIEEVAKLIGDLKHSEEGLYVGPYIQVDRAKLPTMHQVYPGFFITKMGKNLRCYSPEVFHEQFTPKTGAISEWVDFVNRDLEGRVAASG